MNNLKTKVDELDVDKSKNVPVDLKRLSDIVDNEVAKNTKENSCCNYFDSHKSTQHR